MCRTCPAGGPAPETSPRAQCRVGEGHGRGQGPAGRQGWPLSDATVPGKP